jgi:hypothetical protein
MALKLNCRIGLDASYNITTKGRIAFTGQNGRSDDDSVCLISLAT